MIKTKKDRLLSNLVFFLDYIYFLRDLEYSYNGAAISFSKKKKKSYTKFSNSKSYLRTSKDIHYLSHPCCL